MVQLVEGYGISVPIHKLEMTEFIDLRLGGYLDGNCPDDFDPCHHAGSEGCFDPFPQLESIEEIPKEHGFVYLFMEPYKSKEFSEEGFALCRTLELLDANDVRILDWKMKVQQFRYSPQTKKKIIEHGYFGKFQMVVDW